MSFDRNPANWETQWAVPLARPVDLEVAFDDGRVQLWPVLLLAMKKSRPIFEGENGELVADTRLVLGVLNPNSCVGPRPGPQVEWLECEEHGTNLGSLSDSVSLHGVLVDGQLRASSSE